MNIHQLQKLILEKRSYLCVGIDPDIQKLPMGLADKPEGVFHFCKGIIEATLPFAVAYKLNSAFFESLGASGWETMEEIFDFLKDKNVFTIADAKRGDIGNTSAQYAKAFFDKIGADGLTISPYMGQDSISPFLEFPGKTAIILALTSNPGHADFEMQMLENGKRLYEWVMEKSLSWSAKSDMMFVVGATRSAEMEHIRQRFPNAFFLIPGVGAQGGSLSEISMMALTTQCGILINASRSILYASSGSDFKEAAAAEAKRMKEEMDTLLREKGL